MSSELRGIFVSSIGLLLPLTSQAQDAATSQIEEVVVTAQKREERLIDVPQAVTSLSADDLGKIGAVKFSDYANSVPGLSFQSSGAGYTKVSLRGVTAGFDVSPTVAIYLDEVPYGSGSPFGVGLYTLDVGLFDMQRIEVLKGPQGTLYGASSMGGLVKYVSKRPDTTRFENEVQLGLSSVADGGVGYTGAAVVNLPISQDKAAVRLSGNYTRDAGVIDDPTLGRKDVAEADIYGGRGDLLLTPSDSVSLRITALAQNLKRDGEPLADYGFDGKPLYADLTQRRLLPESFWRNYRLVSGTLEVDLEWATLTSITSYQSVEAERIADYSGVYLGVVNAPPFNRGYSAIALSVQDKAHQFTQEVRLANSGRQPFEWVIGGFYTDESATTRQNLQPFYSPGQLAPNDLMAYARPADYEEYAAFGDLTWHLTDKFSATGGLRYAANRITQREIGSGLFVGSRPEASSDESVFTYLLNAQYQFNEHTNLYARYATGYRPGGPNVATLDPVTGDFLAQPSFESDQLKSYEIGFKGETADRRLAVDASVFYIDWSNFQAVDFSSRVANIINASGGAEVRGAELALTARPIRALTFTGAMAYQEAEMSADEPAIGALGGEQLPNAPRFTASLSADYELGVSSLQPTIGIAVRRVGERTADFDHSIYPQYELPEYTSVDLNAGLTWRWATLQLYVRNVSDERGQLSAFTFQGIPQVMLLQPRTIGAVVTTKF